MSEVAQYQREERQDQEQRKGQIREDPIEPRVPVLIVVERREHEQVLLGHHRRDAEEAADGERRAEPLEDEGPQDGQEEVEEGRPVGGDFQCRGGARAGLLQF